MYPNQTPTTRESQDQPTPDAYIDIFPGADTQTITCWYTQENTTTHKYRIEATPTLGDEQTVILSIKGDTTDCDCWEIRNQTEHSDFRIGITTGNPNASAHVTITDTTNTVKPVIRHNTTPNTTPKSHTDDDTSTNSTGNDVMVELTQYSDTTTITETTTDSPHTTFTIEHTTTPNTSRDTESEQTTAKHDEIKALLPSELTYSSSDEPGKTVLETGVEITHRDTSDIPRVGEIKQATEHPGYEVVLNDRSTNPGTAGFFTTGRDYYYTTLQNAVRDITAFILRSERPGKDTAITLDSDVINRDCIEYSEQTKHVVHENTVERDFYRLARVAGTDVWELLHVNNGKEFTQPGVGVEVLGGGELQLAAPQLGESEKEAIVDETLLNDDIPEWKPIMQHIDEIVELFNDSIHRSFTDYIKREMETDTVVKFEFGEQNIMYVPSEHRFEVLVEQAVELALSKRTVILSDDVKDAITSVFGEHLMAVQEAYSRRSGVVGVRFSFTADVWTERAVELNVMGGVPWKAANVAALKEREGGMSNTDIADALDIDKSTVSRHGDTVTRVVRQGEWISENTEL